MDEKMMLFGFVMNALINKYMDHSLEEVLEAVEIERIREVSDDDEIQDLANIQERIENIGFIAGAITKEALDSYDTFFHDDEEEEEAATKGEECPPASLS